MDHLFDRIREYFGWNKKVVMELNEYERYNNEVKERRSFLPAPLVSLTAPL